MQESCLVRGSQNVHRNHDRRTTTAVLCEWGARVHRYSCWAEMNPALRPAKNTRYSSAVLREKHRNNGEFAHTQEHRDLGAPAQFTNP